MRRKEYLNEQPGDYDAQPPKPNSKKNNNLQVAKVVKPPIDAKPSSARLRSHGPEDKVNARRQ